MIEDIERIAQAYIEEAEGDAGAAVRHVVADALADREELLHLISRGIVRSLLVPPAVEGSSDAQAEREAAG